MITGRNQCCFVGTLIPFVMGDLNREQWAFLWNHPALLFTFILVLIRMCFQSFTHHIYLSAVIDQFLAIFQCLACVEQQKIFTQEWHFIRKVDSTTDAHRLYMCCIEWAYMCWKLPSPCFCRQYCLLGDDGWSVLLGRDVWQSRSQTVPPHLHVHKWFLCLPVIVRPGIWHLPRLPDICRLWVSLIKWRSPSWQKKHDDHHTNTCTFKIQLFIKLKKNKKKSVIILLFVMFHTLVD